MNGIGKKVPLLSYHWLSPRFLPCMCYTKYDLAGGILKYGFVEFPQVAILAQFQIDLNLYIGLLML